MSVKPTFIIVTVSDRVEQANALVGQLLDDPRFAGYGMCVRMQDPEGRVGEFQHRNRCTLFQLTDRLEGCHAARVLLLREAHKRGYDGYVNMDDDMEVTEHTDYEPALVKAQERGCGFVMTNWARTRKLLDAKVPAMLDARRGKRFYSQVMLYNGGGMVYGRQVADIIVALPPIPTAFDCAWPLSVYLKGLQSYRDQGSLAIHKVCGTGGMRVFMEATPLHVMGSEWLNFTPASRQDGSCLGVRIPLDKDIKPEARDKHKAARKALMGEV
jgi:hypothetical protein